MSTNARFALVVLVLTLWTPYPSAALAAGCGGGVPCQCGDVVTADYVMTADLGPCAGHGLVIASNAMLDCQGFRIVGLGDGSEQYGVYLYGDTGAEVTGATVRQCEVSGFLRGIRLRATQQSTIVNNVIHDNGNFTTHVGYGIDVAVGSKDNVLQGNVITGNADEGIHFGSNTGPNRFVDNVLFDNYREQIYVLASDGNTFIGNTTYGTGSNSLYLKDSANNYLEANTFRDRVTKVIGSAAGNVFADNAFVNSTLQFSVYSATPDRIPTNNTVLGGSMSHTGTCLRFTNTWGNLVGNLTMPNCGTQVRSESTSAEPSSNTVVDMSLDASRVALDADSTLAVGWWLDLQVHDPYGSPVAGARVQAVDVSGAVVFDAVTDGSGRLAPQSLVQYTRTSSSSVDRTPHTITTSKPGFLPDSRTMEAVHDLAVTVILSPDGTAPDAGVTFFDDFNRPGPTPGNGWVETKGQVVVDGGELRTSGAKGYNLVVQQSFDAANQSVAADFASPVNNTSPRLGVVLRFRDTDNYYLFYWKIGTGTLRISKVVGGVETVLASTPVGNPVRNVMFRLTGHAEDTQLSLELDGVQKVVVSDGSFASGGAGLLIGSKSSKIYRADNFEATAR